MGGEKLGEAVLDLTADKSSLVKTVAGAKAHTVKEMLSGAKASKAAMVAGMAAVGVAVGVGLYKVGKEFDKAYDAIRVGTGKTGDELESLKGSFKNVIKDVPADFEEAGQAIADVNTRLGLTGKPLEERTKQFLELSRITGTDVKGNIESVSKAFVDWEVPVKRQGKVMDGFFRLSQESGISVGKLASSVQQFGSPLRQLGFDLDESAAMFATFEKAGVNTETMVPGLKMAISNLTKPTSVLGEEMEELGIKTGEPKKALQQVMALMNDKSISDVEKTSLAMSVFGKRAGADMAEAIKQGRFEVSDYVDVFRNGKDTIIGAGEDTMSLSEKFKILRNRGMVALEKPAMAVFDGMTKIADVAITLTGLLEGLPAPVKGIIGQLALLAVGVIGAVMAFNKLKMAFIALKVLMLANPYALLIAATIAIAYLIFKNWDKIKKFLSKAWNAIKGVAETVWGKIKAFFAKFWPVLLVVFTGGLGLLVVAVVKHWDQITKLTGKVWDAIKSFFGGIWKGIKTVFNTYLGLVKTVLTTYFNLYRTIITNVFKSVRDIVKNIWDGIRTKIAAVVNGIRTTIANVLDGIRTKMSAVWGTIRTAVVNAWNAVRDKIGGAIKSAIETVRNVIGGVVGWLGEKWKAIIERVGSFAENMKGKLTGAFEGAANIVIGFVNKIIDAINLIPGVNIGHVGKVGGGGKKKAKGSKAQGLYEGGKVTKPMAIVGEEAPRHPEYVIPTNPAYRGRAIGLTSALMSELGMAGVPGFSIGGVLGKLGSVLSGGLGGFLGKLPGPGDLPGWLQGMGKSVIGDVTKWIKNKIGSLLGIGGEKVGDVSISPYIKMVARADQIDSKGYPYVYGGGHGSFNGPYDCSGAVSAVLNAGGALGSPVTTDSLKHYGAAGDGSLVTIGVRGSTGRNAHTMMQLGPRFFESGSGHGARWVSGWSGGFPIHRHPPGMAQGGVLGAFAEMFDPKLVGWGLRKGGVFAGMPYLGSYDAGGILPADGLYMGHEGERVNPKGDDKALREHTAALNRLLESGTADVIEALVQAVSERQGYKHTRGRRRTANDGRMAIA